MQMLNDRQVEELCQQIAELFQARGIGVNADAEAVISAAVWRAIHESMGWN